MKKGSYNNRIVLELFQTGTDIAFQFLLGPWGSFSSGVSLDIAVKQFIRIIFRRIRRKIEQLDSILMPLDPFADFVGVMNLEIIQKYFGAYKNLQLDIIRVNLWFNCNTVADYREAIKALSV